MNKCEMSVSSKFNLKHKLVLGMGTRVPLPLPLPCYYFMPVKECYCPTFYENN